MFIDGHQSSKMFCNDLLCFFSQSFDFTFVKMNGKIELMKKLSFNIGSRIMFNKGTGFRKIGIVAGDRKIGIEIHGIVNSFDRGNRETRGRWGLNKGHGEVQNRPKVCRGLKSCGGGGARSDEMSSISIAKRIKYSSR